MNTQPQAPLTDELMLALIEQRKGNPRQMESGTVFIPTEHGRDHYRRDNGLWYFRKTIKVG